MKNTGREAVWVEKRCSRLYRYPSFLTKKSILDHVKSYFFKRPMFKNYRKVYFFPICKV